jgi:hypothetical protein
MVSNNCLECFHGYFQGFPSHNPLKPLSTCKIIQCICKGFSDLRCLKVTMWWCKPIHHSKFSFEMHGVIYATEPICSIFDTNFYICWRLNKLLQGGSLKFYIFYIGRRRGLKKYVNTNHYINLYLGIFSAEQKIEVQFLKCTHVLSPMLTKVEKWFGCVKDIWKILCKWCFLWVSWV